MRVMVSDGRDGEVRHLVVHAPEGARVHDLLGRLGDDRPGPASGDVPLHHGQELRPVSGTAPVVAAGLGPLAPRGPVLVVAAGPDAGGTLLLPPGRWVTVGRDATCDLVIEDPSLSRRHVRIRLDRDSVDVEDLDSTNGLAWDTGGRSPVWRAGDRLLLGRSVLVLEPRQPAPASVVQRDGHLELVPWRRERPSPRAVELTSPAEPVRRTVRRPSVWTWALPLAVAGVVALVLRMPWLLLFGLLGPAMVFGHHLGDRRAARDEHRDAMATHRRHLQELDLAAQDALRAELAARWEVDPGVVGVTAALHAGPSTRLWECSGEPLTAVLGEAPDGAGVTVDGARLRHGRAPLVVDVRPGLVIAGPPTLRDALARSLVLQLAARHPPDTFTLAVDPARPPGGAWDVLAWLPHTRLGGRRGTDVRWGTDLRLVDDLRAAPSDVPRVLLLGPHEAVLQRPGLPDRPFRPTLLRLGRARSFARALAPLRSGHPPGGQDHATGSTALGELVPWPSRPKDAARGWSRPGLTVPLGHAEGGPVTVDLAVDGPHALVAGTTGAGKSELLRSLVVALALRNSPADLTLLLIDYKGGSSLGSCAGLPQVTGLVTDLDPHLAERVLVSLQAELRRREQVLHASGARDIRDLGQPGLSRLVVVIDEFRVLAEEVPQVMDGLVRVAAVGRSLGVHLVLATQRPAGIVGADLRANVNLRIALRVRDAADSFDVLDCADAAGLPEGRPGLALLRTGASPPRSVQVAVARPAHRTRTTDGWRITEHSDVWAARSALEAGGAAGEADEDDPVLGLAASLSAAAKALSLRASTVWLPPLPEDLSSDPGREDAWAIADLPGQQHQPPLTWPADHHIGIVGASRSGRTTALRSLLSRTRAWFVALDLGRALHEGWAGAQDARCCAWVLPEDRAHALRVLDLLLTLVQDRQADPRAPRDPLVLALDGWDRLVDQLGQVEGGRGVEVAQRILREGPGVGVTGVVTGDRSLLLGTMATLLPETWMLHLNDPTDLLLTGLRAAQVPSPQPPGRVVRARDGVVAQVVRPDPAGGRPPPGQTPPLRCLPLPRLARRGDPTVWAVGGDEAAAVDLPAGPVLVLGPPGSGRSRTLAALAAASGGAALMVAGSDPPSEHDLQARLQQLDGEDLVSVDDAHLLVGTPVEDLLVGHAARHGARVVLHAATELEGAATAFRGLLPQLARSRTAVVLQPGMPGDGAVVGARLPVGDLPVPGRGVLVHRGRTTRIQVVAPPPGRGGRPSGEPGASG